MKPIGKHTISIYIIAALVFVSLSATAQPETLTGKLEEAIKGKKSQVGIAVIINGKDTVTVNNSRQYPMLSVFKFHQALAVMDYLDKKQLTPDTELLITTSDLKPNTYSPLRDKYPEGTQMSIARLLEYMLQLSDNNACDILFRFAGGPEAADRYIRSLGIEEFAITATEEDMHKDINKSYDNHTTPLACAELIEIFLHKRLFSETSQQFIRKTMIECQTGKSRLVAPLIGTDAVIGHKTGSGPLNEKGQCIATNDAGFVFLPNGNYYSVAVFVKDSEEGNETNENIISNISKIVYQYVSNLK